MPDNSHKGHVYRGLDVYFGTKHDKARVIEPLLAQMGMGCKTVPIDTDVFGTFTGEVEREGTVIDNLRKKISATKAQAPEARLLLASEGSFLPHPLFGFVQSDHEALLFYDSSENTEIFVSELISETNHHQVELEPSVDPDQFLQLVQFPSHAVIARPKGREGLSFKGLNSFKQLHIAIRECRLASPAGIVVLSSDLRASFNPTRMKAIARVGEKLVERLQSPCPSCLTLGFAPVRGIPGLPCRDCHLPTRSLKEVVWGCVRCSQEVTRVREDGLTAADPGECDYCNP